MPEPKLRIAEIFTSIQGEGIWVGTPSTFVRVSGCNLRCRWCDTPYASWNPEGPTLTITEMLERVPRAPGHVVLTGGEPMLFDGIEPLVAQLKERGHVLTVETAGTVVRELGVDLFSISPKLSNSTPEGEWMLRHEETRQSVDTVARLMQTAPYQLKFVIDPEGDGADLAEVRELVSQLKPEPDRVLVMAEGTDPETLHRRERLLVPICLHEGWRLTPRFHVDLFGNTRGT